MTKVASQIPFWISPWRYLYFIAVLRRFDVEQYLPFEEDGCLKSWARLVRPVQMHERGQTGMHAEHIAEFNIVEPEHLTN